MGWNPIKDAERAARKVVDKIVNPAANAAKSLVNKAGDEVRSGVRRAGSEVEKGVKRIGSEVEDGVKKVGNEIEDGVRNVGHEVEEGVRTAARETEEAFTEKLPDLLEDALEEMLAAAASGALDKAIDIIQVALPSSVDLKIGPVGLAIGDITTKVDTLQRWARSPPTGKGDIREMVQTLSPTGVSVELSFSLALLVVQSDSLELGITINYETADFLDKIEEITGKF